MLASPLQPAGSSSTARACASGCGYAVGQQRVPPRRQRVRLPRRPRQRVLAKRRSRGPRQALEPPPRLQLPWIRRRPGQISTSCACHWPPPAEPAQRRQARPPPLSASCASPEPGSHTARLPSHVCRGTTPPARAADTLSRAQPLPNKIDRRPHRPPLPKCFNPNPGGS
ncbi:hypothetical protein BS78_07G039600 [Paspalum vaginatum]|nr:hypothetical protein BS78_07G039600 [Paspalum vaginatum]